MNENAREGCGNSPLTMKQILELAYWGASCYQDDFIHLIQRMEKQLHLPDRTGDGSELENLAVA